MSTSEQNTQSAAERRAADAQAVALVATHASAHQELVSSMRKLLRKRLPTAYELVYEYTDWVVISYSPNENGYDGVLAIRVSAKGVALYFNRGKGLPDPEKLLQGSAKLVRYIPVESAATLTSPAVTRLIDEAIAGNPIPFAATGPGPVVIRSQAAKKRR